MKKIGAFLRLAVYVTVGTLVIMTAPWAVGAALAATGEAPPVPPPTPDAIASYVTSYGWIVGLVALAYVVAKVFLQKNESEHWIAQGRTLAVIAAAVGVLGTGLQAYTAGTPWSGVIATAVLGVLHLFDAQTVPAEKGGAS